MPPPELESISKSEKEESRQMSEKDCQSAILADLKSGNGQMMQNLIDITSRLGDSIEGLSNDVVKHEDDDLMERLKAPSVFPKIQQIVKISVPVVGSFLLYLSSTFVILYYAGHISSKANDSTVFAGISMANMFANVSLFSILIGMTSAVETLGSQNNGAKNYREVGIILQRSIVVLSMLLIPIVVIWLFVEDIFSALGTDRGISNVMGRYLRIRMLTMPIDVLSKSYEKYLCCLGLTRPAMFSQLVAVVGTAVFGAIFVHWFEWGYESLASAFVISTYLSLIALIFFSINDPAVQRTLQPLSMEAFSNIKEFMILGFPGLVMLCAEWWAFELLTLFASQMGPEAVASQTIIIQMASLAFMIPLGISTAACTIVGNALGATEVDLAKELSRLCVLSLVVCELFISPAILLMGDDFIALFTDDELVQEFCRKSIIFLSLFTWGDGLCAVLGGITRGAGQQHLGAFANVPAYYFVALPLSWYLCFHTWLEVVGLIVGIAAGPILTSIFLLYLIFCRSEKMFTNPEYSLVNTSPPVVPEEEGVVSLELTEV